MSRPASRPFDTSPADPPCCAHQGFADTETKFKLLRIVERLANQQLCGEKMRLAPRKGDHYTTQLVDAEFAHPTAEAWRRDTVPQSPEQQTRDPRGGTVATPGDVDVTWSTHGCLMSKVLKTQGLLTRCAQPSLLTPQQERAQQLERFHIGPPLACVVHRLQDQHLREP